MIHKLQQFSITPEGEEKVRIQARMTGLLPFVMGLFGKAPSVSLVCTKECVEFKSTDVKGFHSVAVPTSAVTGVLCGSHKPIMLFIMGAVIFGIAVLGFLRPEAIVESMESQRVQESVVNAEKALEKANGISYVLGGAGLFMMFLYMLTKQTYIGFENGGDKHYRISFKPSKIDGVKIDATKLQEATSVINKAVLEAK